MVDSNDQRDFHRMMVECEIAYRPVSGGDLKSGMAQNISASGLLFSCDEALDVGLVLEVNIVAEKALVPPLHAIVEVLRVLPASESGGYAIACKVREIIG